MMMLMRNMRTMASQLWSGRASASPHIATQNLQNADHDTPTNVFHLWRFLHIIQTLPKAQRTRGLSSAYQSNFISQVLSQILIKHLQNLDLAPTSKSQPNIGISTKLKLKISTKIEVHSHNQASAGKY